MAGSMRTNRKTRGKFHIKTSGREFVQLSLLQPDRRPDLQLDTDSVSIHDTLETYVPNSEEGEFDALLVGQYEGEIYEIWGIHGVPYTYKNAELLYRSVDAFERLGRRYPGSQEE